MIFHSFTQHHSNDDDKFNLHSAFLHSKRFTLSTLFIHTGGGGASYVATAALGPSD